MYTFYCLFTVEKSQNSANLNNFIDVLSVTF